MISNDYHHIPLRGVLGQVYADDAVLAHNSLDGIEAFTKLIDTFSQISGFGVNREKCNILHVLDTTTHENDRLKTFPWANPITGKSLTFTNKAIYLGILVGTTSAR